MRKFFIDIKIDGDEINRRSCIKLGSIIIGKKRVVF